MRFSRSLALTMTLFGATVLFFSRGMIANLPEHNTGSASTGVGGFWNLFLDACSWLLHGGSVVLGVMPLVVGILGLLVSGFPQPSLPAVSDGPSTFDLEEKWEYLPQEGRGKPKPALETTDDTNKVPTPPASGDAPIV